MNNIKKLFLGILNKLKDAFPEQKSDLLAAYNWPKNYDPTITFEKFFITSSLHVRAISLGKIGEGTINTYSFEGSTLMRGVNLSEHFSPEETDQRELYIKMRDVVVNYLKPPSVQFIKECEKNEANL